jgi:hypothetical protein
MAGRDESGRSEEAEGPLLVKVINMFDPVLVSGLGPVSILKANHSSTSGKGGVEPTFRTLSFAILLLVPAEVALLEGRAQKGSHPH